MEALTIEDNLGHKLVDERKRAADASKFALLQTDRPKSTLFEIDKPKSTLFEIDEPKSVVLEIEEPNFANEAHSSAQQQTTPSEWDRPDGSNVGLAQVQGSTREDSSAASVPLSESTRSQLREPKTEGCNAQSMSASQSSNPQEQR